MAVSRISVDQNHRSGMWLPSPPAVEAISPRVAARAIQVLFDIQPGSTVREEVLQRFGAPTSRGERFLTYALGKEGSWLNVHFKEQVVQALDLDKAMTLGDLVAVFGPPSTVYRSSRFEIGIRSLGRTVLVYEQRMMVAVIEQGLCEFPVGIVLDFVLLLPPDGDIGEEILSTDAVEVEWSGVVKSLAPGNPPSERNV